MCFIVLQALSNGEDTQKTASSTFVNPVTLYKKVLDTIYERRCKHRNVEIRARKEDMEAVFKLAQRKAFECFKEQRVLFDFNHSEKALQDNAKLRSFLFSGLIRPVNKTMCQFMHKSFMEYFVAEYLYEHHMEMATQRVRLVDESASEVLSSPAFCHGVDEALPLMTVVRNDLSALSDQLPPQWQFSAKTDNEIRNAITNVQAKNRTLHQRDEIRRGVIEHFAACKLRQVNIWKNNTLIDVNDQHQQRNMLSMLAHKIAHARRLNLPKSSERYRLFTRVVCASFYRYVEAIKQAIPSKALRTSRTAIVEDVDRGDVQSAELFEALFGDESPHSALMETFHEWCGCSTLVEIATAFQQGLMPETFKNFSRVAVLRLAKNNLQNTFLEDLLCAESIESSAPRFVVRTKHWLKRKVGGPPAFATWLFTSCAEQNALGTFLHLCNALGEEECNHLVSSRAFDRDFISALQNGSTEIRTLLESQFSASVNIYLALSLGAVGVVKAHLRDHNNTDDIQRCLKGALHSKQFELVKVICDANRQTSQQREDHLRFCSTTLPALCLASVVDHAVDSPALKLDYTIWQVLRFIQVDNDPEATNDERTAFVLGIADEASHLISPIDTIASHCPRSARHVVMRASLAEDATRYFHDQVNSKMTTVDIVTSYTKKEDPLPSVPEWLVELFTASATTFSANCSIDSEVLVSIAPIMEEISVRGIVYTSESSVHKLKEHLGSAASSFRSSQLHVVRFTNPLQHVDEQLQHLTFFSHLRCLDFSECLEVSDVGLQHLRGTLPQLQSLDISNNSQITDCGLQAVATFAELDRLDISGCKKVSDIGLKHLLSLPLRLQHLDASSCSRITNGGLEHLSKLTTVRHLFISNVPKVSDDGIYLISQLPLQSLSLSGCSNITDMGMEHLKSQTSLTALDITGCSVGDQGLTYVSSLTNLRRLDTSECANVTDFGLQHISSLSNLESLTLKNCCKITDFGLGFVAAALEKLRDLRADGCGNLGDEAMFKLASISSLQSLSLQRCGLVTSNGIDRIRSLPHLKHLDISGCVAATDSGALSVASLTRLQTLRVARCNIRTITHLYLLKELTQLDVSHNTKIERFMKNVASLHQLRDLAVSHCITLSDHALRHLRVMSLHRLDITECTNVGDAGLAHIGTLSQLTELRMTKCLNVTDDGLRHLTSLHHLHRLEMATCDNITDAGIRHLTSLHLLHSLDISDCQHLTNQSLQLVATLMNLRELRARDCKHLTDIGMKSVASLQQLQLLDVSGCHHVTDSGVFHLAGQPHLRALFVNDCANVTDIALTCLSSKMHLKALGVGGCAITSSGLASLRTLELEHLDISGCAQVDDSGMQHVASMAQLEHLDISGCVNVTDEGIRLLVTSLPNLLYFGCQKKRDTIDDEDLPFKPPSHTPNDHRLHLSFLHFASLSRLQHLDLSGRDEVNDDDLRNLTPNLRVLIVSSKHISDNGIFNIGSPNLEHLSLCKCTNVTDSVLVAAAVRGLHRLELAGCNISDEGLHNLAPLLQLRHFNISSCPDVTDSGMRLLACLTQLEFLEVAHCNIHNSGVRLICSFLPQLRRLDISQCPVDDRALVHLSCLRELEDLRMDKCSVALNRPFDLLEHTRFRHFSCCQSLFRLDDPTDIAPPFHLFQRLKTLRVSKICCKSQTELDSLVSICSKEVLEHLTCVGSDAALQVLSSMSALRKLEMVSCSQVTDTGLQKVASLPLLEYLSVCGSKNVTNSGLQHIASLSHLTTLILDDTPNISDVGLQFLSSVDYRRLDLSQCSNISDSGISMIKSLRHLTFLDLSGCNITDSALRDLSSLVQLQCLRLCSCTNVTNRGFQYLAALKSLRDIIATDCINVGDDGLRYIADLVELQSLSVGGCTNVTDVGLQYLSSLLNIRRLDLNQCTNVTDSGLSILSTLSQLAVLTLKNCNVTDAGLHHLAPLPHLCRLVISGDCVTNTTLLQLSNSTNDLLHLDISGCAQVDDSGMQHVASMAQLEHLDISGCVNVTGEGIKLLKKKLRMCEIKCDFVVV